MWWIHWGRWLRGQGEQRALQCRMCCLCRRPGAFEPKLKWHWDGSNSPYPEYNQVMMAPVVGRILDTNGDGRIDETDAPILVFSTFTKSQGYDGQATLRVVNGVTGMDIYSIRDAAVSSMGGIVLADIDGDGIPEIVTLTRTYQAVAFRNTGEKIWISPVVVNASIGGNTPWARSVSCRYRYGWEGGNCRRSLRSQ